MGLIRARQTQAWCFQVFHLERRNSAQAIGRDLSSLDFTNAKRGDVPSVETLKKMVKMDLQREFMVRHGRLWNTRSMIAKLNEGSEKVETAVCFVVGTISYGDDGYDSKCSFYAPPPALTTETPEGPSEIEKIHSIFQQMSTELEVVKAAISDLNKYTGKTMDELLHTHDITYIPDMQAHSDLFTQGQDAERALAEAMVTHNTSVQNIGNKIEKLVDRETNETEQRRRRKVPRKPRPVRSY
ncbi:hypothetical protein N7478_001761 [Penicillium angulare]|uniref:uncharacterized protein n=1 Tax=Penicillium angulare TaxID=116970 RepID=UPI00253F7966|nr:uncharacterized protein N7478_001761 [Penicillium angulare]KAJ5288731.1 hypothetical protein N7478_001761 [Penicillium angulare]